MTYLKPHVYGNFKTPLEKRTKPKSPVEKREGKEAGYLSKIDALPCCVCGKSPPSEHHHLKCAGGRGMGMKAADKWTVPLCHDHHINGVERVGSKREAHWFKIRGIDCLTLAAGLYANRHSVEAMRAVLEAHRG